jgi:hypothetical protein
MAAKCAADVGIPNQVMVGFVMFYRLLSVQIPATAGAMLGRSCSLGSTLFFELSPSAWMKFQTLGAAFG